MEHDALRRTRVWALGKPKPHCNLVPLTCRHARENLPGRAAKRQSYVPAHQRRDAGRVLHRRRVWALSRERSGLAERNVSALIEAGMSAQSDPRRAEALDVDPKYYY